MNKKSNPKPPEDSPAIAEKKFEPITSLKMGLSMKPDYLIKDFLEIGEQALLYGQPKVGKTFLAIQLACAVATKRPFLKWEVPAARKVLYVNFEMGQRAFALRIAKQLDQPNNKLSYEENWEYYDQQLGGNLIFSVVPRSIEIFEHFELLSDYLKDQQPDLVVIDTLSKIHAADERHNNAIQLVLTKLREACDTVGKPVAQLIVHHARKSAFNMEDKGSPTADEIRGGSAIRGEADLIIGLVKRSGRKGGGKRISVLIEARNISSAEVDLKQNKDLIFSVDAVQKAELIEDAFEKELKSIREPVKKSDIVERVLLKFKDDYVFNSARDKLTELLNARTHLYTVKSNPKDDRRVSYIYPVKKRKSRQGNTLQ